MIQCNTETLEFPKLFKTYVVKVLVFQLLIVTCNEAVKIGWKGFSFREQCHSFLPCDIRQEFFDDFCVPCVDLTFVQNAIKLFLGDGVFVGEDLFPLERRNDVESHFGFEIGLIKEREDPTGKV